MVLSKTDIPLLQYLYLPGSYQPAVTASHFHQISFCGDEPVGCNIHVNISVCDGGYRFLLIYKGAFHIKHSYGYFLTWLVIEPYMELSVIGNRVNKEST